MEIEISQPLDLFFRVVFWVPLLDACFHIWFCHFFIYLFRKINVISFVFLFSLDNLIFPLVKNKIKLFNVLIL